MTETNHRTVSDLCSQLESQQLPRWEVLPDLELYMDQVRSLVSRYLGSYLGFDEKGLTPSMVNNYVKLGVLPAPRHKRYSREHIARLLVICLLKASLPIASIQVLMENAVGQMGMERFYDSFCEMFERVTASAASEHVDADSQNDGEAIIRAALRAQAEQGIAMRLYSSLYPEAQGK